MSSRIEMAMSLAKEFEGCRLQAYPDPASGGDPWTVGWGATGPDIRQGTVWTQQQADADLQNRLSAISMRVDELVKVPLNDEPKAALDDFAYNEGLGNLQRSTLLAELNAGNMQGAADQFLVWNMAAGKVMDGLERRRQAERALFMLGANFDQGEQNVMG